MRLFALIAISVFSGLMLLADSIEVGSKKSQPPTVDENGFIDQMVPLYIQFGPNDEILMFGSAVSLDKLREMLRTVGKANPAQPVLIVASDRILQEKVRQVIDLCNSSHLTRVIRLKKDPPMRPPLPETRRAAGN